MPYFAKPNNLTSMLNVGEFPDKATAEKSFFLDFNPPEPVVQLPDDWPQLSSQEQHALVVTLIENAIANGEGTNAQTSIDYSADIERLNGAIAALDARITALENS